MQDERDAPKAISTSYALMTLTYMFTVVTAYGLQGVGVEDFLPNSLEEVTLPRFKTRLFFRDICYTSSRPALKRCCTLYTPCRRPPRSHSYPRLPT